VYFELENHIWFQYFFFTNALRKKQLDRQEVPERRSKINTNKNF